MENNKNWQIRSEGLPSDLAQSISINWTGTTIALKYYDAAVLHIFDWLKNLKGKELEFILLDDCGEEIGSFTFSDFHCLSHQCTYTSETISAWNLMLRYNKVVTKVGKQQQWKLTARNANCEIISDVPVVIAKRPECTIGEESRPLPNVATENHRRLMINGALADWYWAPISQVWNPLNISYDEAHAQAFLQLSELNNIEIELSLYEGDKKLEVWVLIDAHCTSYLPINKLITVIFSNAKRTTAEVQGWDQIAHCKETWDREQSLEALSTDLLAMYKRHKKH